jgi:hypothetical protein
MFYHTKIMDTPIPGHLHRLQQTKGSSLSTLGRFPRRYFNWRLHFIGTNTTKLRWEPFFSYPITFERILEQ